MIIPILLVVIICILLFGAAAIKAAIVRNLLLMATLLALVLLWQAAKALPVGFWWAIGALVVGGVGLMFWVDANRINKVKKAFDEEIAADEAAYKSEEAARLTAELQQHRDFGMTDAEIAEYERLRAAGDFEGSSRFFSDCMGRVAREKISDRQ